MGRYEDAIEKFYQALDDNHEAADYLSWNEYVSGTIYFLQGDTEKLEQEIEKIESRNLEMDGANLSILKSYLRCPDESYLRRSILVPHLVRMLVIFQVFCKFKGLLQIIAGRHIAHGNRLQPVGFCFIHTLVCGQSCAQGLVNYLFVAFAAAVGGILQRFGNPVVNCQCRSHTRHHSKKI